MKIKNPFSKLMDPVNHEICERFLEVFCFDGICNQMHDELLLKISKSIDSMTPDLLVNFNQVYQELTCMIQNQAQIIHDIERKFKKLFDSSSLTEDVYKMRDEMKVLKKKLDKINSGFKLFARSSKVLEDDDE